VRSGPNAKVAEARARRSRRRLVGVGVASTILVATMAVAMASPMGVSFLKLANSSCVEEEWDERACTAIRSAANVLNLLGSD
jgi:hypothetical protein